MAVETPISGTPVSEASVAQRRLPTWSALPWPARPVLIYVATRLFVLVALLVAEAFSHRGFAGEIGRWDSRWFLLAAAHGWPAHLPAPPWPAAQSTVAFFPLFPLTIAGLHGATGLPLLGAGATLSLLTGLTAMIAVWALGRELAGAEAADRATLAVAVFPASFVFSMVYAEGFVITFVAAGLLALLRHKWLLAGVLGALATATSPIALAFVVSAAWASGAAIRRERNWRSLAAPLLAPLGFIAYMLALGAVTGHLTAWSTTERHGWHSYLSLRYPFHVVWKFLRSPAASGLSNDLLLAGIIVGVALLVLAAFRRLPIPVLLYGLVVVVGAMLSVPVGLRPRFLLLAFPLLMTLGMALRGRWYWTAMCLSAVGLGVLTVYSVSYYAVFP